MVSVRGTTVSKAKTVASRRTKARNYNKKRRARDIPKQKPIIRRKTTSGRGGTTDDDRDRARFFTGTTNYSA